jgi:hypothetical protein
MPFYPLLKTNAGRGMIKTSIPENQLHLSGFKVMFWAPDYLPSSSQTKSLLFTYTLARIAI